MFLAAAIGAKLAHGAEQILGEKKILIILSTIMIICFFGMSGKRIILGVIFPVLLFVSSGMFEPIIADYINKLLESHHRATIMSLHVLVIDMFSTIIAPFFGFVVDAWGLSSAFIMAGSILLVNLAILVAIYLYNPRNLKIT